MIIIVLMLNTTSVHPEGYSSVSRRHLIGMAIVLLSKKDLGSTFCIVLVFRDSPVGLTLVFLGIDFFCCFRRDFIYGW